MRWLGLVKWLYTFSFCIGVGGCIDVEGTETPCPEGEILQILGENAAHCVRQSQVGRAPLDCTQDYFVPIRDQSGWKCIEEPVEVLDFPPINELSTQKQIAIKEALRFVGDDSDSSDIILRDIFADEEGVNGLLANLEYLPAAIYAVSWARAVGLVHHFRGCRCRLTDRERYCEEATTGTSTVSRDVLQSFHRAPTGSKCVANEFGTFKVRELTLLQFETLAPAACPIASYRQPPDETTEPIIPLWYADVWDKCKAHPSSNDEGL